MSSGTEPETISGTYVGTLVDGIAPGLDMLIFKMSGAPITTQSGAVDRGIWAGMSGSPLYAEDGRLVGAISYGLSAAPSEYAGVTPAAAMYHLRSYEQPPPKVVPLTKRLTQRLQRHGVSPQQSSGGMARLRMPLNVTASGPLSRVERLAKRTGHGGVALRRAGGVGAEGAADIPIRAGGNLADSIAYGDLTMGSIGTATAVCGTEVIGFGHPDSFTGKTSLAMHGADAVYIEKDVLGSFKVANFGTPQGTITQDRLAGILGTVGALPSTTRVTVSATSPYNVHTGTTHNSMDDYLSMVAATQVMVDADVANDRMGEGRAQLSWTVRLQRHNGTTFTYQRSNVFSDREDLTGTMPTELASDIDTILGNRFAHVRINAVKVTADSTPEFESYRVSRLDYRSHGSWTTATDGSVVTRAPGQRLRVRVTLAPKAASSGTVHRFTETVRVPSDGTTRAVLKVRGHLQPWWTYRTGMRGATSLPQLLKTMSSAPHNDTVSVTLAGKGGGTGVTRDHTAPSTVSGSASLHVRIAR
ncbi:MAG TPA: hypothetical protein VFJ12_01465 [Segeticoccus sp.]|nr:hypothetical protein [Segeticoccus sp.]